MNEYAMPVKVLVSLDEPVRELFFQLREYTVNSLRSHVTATTFNYGKFTQEDYRQYMDGMMRELKYNIGSPTIRDETSCTAWLSNNGVPWDLSDRVTGLVWTMIIDIIATHFPKITFGEMYEECEFKFEPPNTMAVIFPAGTQFV